MKPLRLILLLAAFTTIVACTHSSKEKRMLTKHEWQRETSTFYENEIPEEEPEKINESIILRFNKDNTGYFTHLKEKDTFEYSLNDKNITVLFKEDNDDNLTISYKIVMLNENTLILNQKYTDNLYDQQVYKKVE